MFRIGQPPLLKDHKNGLFTVVTEKGSRMDDPNFVLPSKDPTSDAMEILLQVCLLLSTNLYARITMPFAYIGVFMTHQSRFLPPVYHPQKLREKFAEVGMAAFLTLISDHFVSEPNGTPEMYSGVKDDSAVSLEGLVAFLQSLKLRFDRAVLPNLILIVTDGKSEKHLTQVPHSCATILPLGDSFSDTKK